MSIAKRPRGILLFPGAGSDSNHTSLLSIERAVSPTAVRRCDFGYRKAGKRAPDRAPLLLQCVRDEAASFAAQLDTPTSDVILGGRSMGGRMCSMAVAGGTDLGPALPARGLILISYPLHPPGKPDKLRVEHLARIAVPCLFIHGTRDTFGSPDELQQWTATIPAPVRHVWLDRKGHDLKGADDAISSAVVDWLDQAT